MRLYTAGHLSQSTRRHTSAVNAHFFFDYFRTRCDSVKITTEILMPYLHGSLSLTVFYMNVIPIEYYASFVVACFTLCLHVCLIFLLVPSLCEPLQVLQLLKKFLTVQNNTRFRKFWICLAVCFLGHPLRRCF